MRDSSHLTESSRLLATNSITKSPINERPKSTNFFLYGCVLLLASVILFIYVSTISYAYYNVSEVSRFSPLSTVQHTTPPSSYWGSIKAPYPTGAFWTNFVVGDGDGSALFLPYGIKCLSSGIQVSYGPTRRVVTNKAITDPFDVDIQFTSLEPYNTHNIIKHDNFSVTMKYNMGTAGGSYTAYLVKGSPYVTILYEQSTPILNMNTMHITNFQSITRENSIGNQYVVTLGNYQNWLIWGTSDLSLSVSGDSLISSVAYSGVIRVAILPIQNADKSMDLLLKYISCYPIGVDIDISYPQITINQQGNPLVTPRPQMAKLTYRFRTVGEGDLLMLALPHHIDIMTPYTPLTSQYNDTKAVRRIYTPIYSMKGKMVPCIGQTWELQYQLQSPSWVYDLSNTMISTPQLNSIAQALLQDLSSVIPSAIDVYGFGKEVARMATLALIADNLGISSIRQNALQIIENTITTWLRGTNPNAFVYDSVYGGVITAQSMTNSASEFGLGWYNDHHFQYGYFIYTGAVLSLLDKPYFAQNRAVFDYLVSDICQNNATDTNFPYVRHKDFYDGHSWASGLFQQANGKGQESSTEVCVYC
jgi:endo-1,3(4)-beta-glucanase